MSKKKTKTTKKKVIKKTKKASLKKVEIPETPADIPVEEQFDFNIQGSPPITVGIDNKVVNSSTFRKVNIPDKPKNSGQLTFPKKKRKPKLNTKVIKPNQKKFF